MIILLNGWHTETKFIEADNYDQAKTKSYNFNLEVLKVSFIGTVEKV